MTTQNKVERYNWLPIADGPQLKTIPVSRLKVDHSYQRSEVFEQAVLEIARNFDWAKFGAISVVDRNGELYVTDGQQRLAAVLRRGDVDRVPCVVTRSIGISHEAEVFIGINTNRKVVNSYDKYRAGLTAGNLIYVMAEQIVASRGLRVHPETTPKHVAFPTLLLRTVRQNPEECARCIDLQREAIGPNEALHNYVHKGLFYIATNQKTGDIHTHGQTLFRQGGLPMMLNAIRGAAIEIGNASVSERICAVGILQVVNKSRKRSKVTL